MLAYVQWPNFFHAGRRGKISDLAKRTITNQRYSSGGLVLYALAAGPSAGAHQRRQLGREFRTLDSLQPTLVVSMKVPKAAVVPMAGVLPIRSVDDRVETDTLYRNAAAPGDHHFRRCFFRPKGAANTEVSSLGDKHGAPVASVEVDEQLGKRHPATVSR